MAWSVTSRKYIHPETSQEAALHLVPPEAQEECFYDCSTALIPRQVSAILRACESDVRLDSVLCVISIQGMALVHFSSIY